MGKPNLRIATADEAPPSRTRTPEREALAESLERHTELVRRLAAIEAAERTARLEHDAALAASAAATAAIEDAKTDAAQHRINRVLGIRGPAPKSVLFRREQAQAADDERASAASARIALAEQRKQAENALITARVGLDSRIKAVLAAESPVERLVADYRVLAREFATRTHVLEFLEQHHALPYESHWRRVSGDLLDGVAPWEAALAALETDPDAPLPS